MRFRGYSYSNEIDRITAKMVSAFVRHRHARFRAYSETDDGFDAQTTS